MQMQTSNKEHKCDKKGHGVGLLYFHGACREEILHPLVVHGIDPLMLSPKIFKGILVNVPNLAVMTMGKHATADRGCDDTVGKRGSGRCGTGGECLGKELHDNRLPVLEVDLRAWKTNGDLKNLVRLIQNISQGELTNYILTESQWRPYAYTDKSV